MDGEKRVAGITQSSQTPNSIYALRRRVRRNRLPILYIIQTAAAVRIPTPGFRSN